MKEQQMIDWGCKRIRKVEHKKSEMEEGFKDGLQLLLLLVFSTYVELLSFPFPFPF